MRNTTTEWASETPCTMQDFAITEMCQAFEVSRSGYYQWKDGKPSKRQQESDQIIEQIRSIHDHRHLQAYGSPRVTRELRDRGFESISENRVARLMRENDLPARFGKPFHPKTTKVDKTQRFNLNLVAQSACPEAPGEIVVSDITYVGTQEGWLYLAVVVDLYSRAVLGWNIHTSLETEFLVTPAIARSLDTGILHSGAIFHSDRGCQYTSKLTRAQLKASGLRQSMSAAGYCYDNAYCESFFASLKAEAFPENAVFESKQNKPSSITSKHSTIAIACTVHWTITLPMISSISTFKTKKLC